MDKAQSISVEITELTNKIETDYPEIYKFLDEDPMTIPNMAHPDIDEKALRAYLDDLKELVKQYLKTHKPA